MATKKSDADFAQDAIDDIVKGIQSETSSQEDGLSFTLNPPLFESLYKRYVEALAATSALAHPSAEPHNESMTDVTRPEIDAKLEAIEARMDARVARIEEKIDGLVSLFTERDKRFEERDKRLESIAARAEQSAEKASDLKRHLWLSVAAQVAAIAAIIIGAYYATYQSNISIVQGVIGAIQFGQQNAPAATPQPSKK
ncbi:MULTISPECIES: hypothetical protein [Cupriavidus]